MSNNDKTKGGCCCTSPTPGLRMLTFPDGIRLAVFGLDKIFAAVYDEGREVNTDTAADIVKRLAVNNYIASSARQKYCDLLIEEYRKYVHNRADDSKK